MNNTTTRYIGDIRITYDGFNAESLEELHEIFLSLSQFIDPLINSIWVKYGDAEEGSIAPTTVSDVHGYANIYIDIDFYNSFTDKKAAILHEFGEGIFTCMRTG